MRKNMGWLDRSLRILLAVIIGILYFTGVITGTVAIVLLIVAVAFIVTGFISTCPLYLPFGISTRKNKNDLP
ncbi:YgaP family membrane protein [Pedobacter sp.]|uniref:YgaP family membrane protein n=1 Tax=Pedobacter sp. TaxID=1411316 RepID=UPI003C54F81B